MAAFLAWSATLDKILTVDNLRKRHVIKVDRCCLCKKNGESVDHLLLHCNVASTLCNAPSALCNALFTHFGMSWVMPRRVIDLFACWWTSGRPMNVAICKMVPICLFFVWNERKNVFRGHRGYFSFVFSYFVSLNGDFCVSTVA
jgi:hypothetical protein